VSYEQEANKQQEKIDAMTARDKDDYDIRKQVEVLEESRRMVPDCERRLIAAWDELSKLVDSGPELNETAEYKLAKEVLEETRATAKR
jgi:tubulin-specific chaperone A